MAFEQYAAFIQFKIHFHGNDCAPAGVDLTKMLRASQKWPNCIQNNNKNNNHNDHNNNDNIYSGCPHHPGVFQWGPANYNKI